MFVGREDVLDRCRRDVRAGAATIIVGEPGIGKTAVLHELARAIDRPVVHGGAIEPLRWMPWLPLTRACGCRVGPARGDALRQVHAVLGDASVLAIDDAHWADADTMDLLGDLAQRYALVVTARSDEPGLAAVMAALGDRASVLRLGPLPDADARRLAEGHLHGATETEIAAVVAASSGIPLLLTCSAPVDAPADARLRAQVARASTGARRLLARSQLAGRPVVSPSQVATELDQLRLAVVGQDGCTPRHDLIGRAAVALLDATEVLDLHRSLAASADSAGERARHLLAAGEPDRARSEALTAAATASSRAERADHLAVAAAASPSDDVATLEEAVHALCEAARIQDALEVAQRMRPASRVDELRAATALARAAWHAADHPLTRVALDRGLELVDADEGRAEARLRLLHARYLLRVMWDTAAAREEARRAVELATVNGLPLGEYHSLMGSIAVASGDPSWSGWFERALDAARASDDHALELSTGDSLFMAQFVAGDARACAPLASRLVDRARDVGSEVAAMQMRKNALLARFHVEGELLPIVEEARALLDLPLHARQRDHIESHLVLAFADLGDDDASIEAMAGAYGLTAADDTARAMILWARAEADWQAGRYGEAIAVAEECRALPVAGFPAHSMVEPIRQWCCWELNLPTGEALTSAGFPNFVAAMTESAAIVALAADPTDPTNADRFDAAAAQWSRISQRGALRCRWAAGHAAALAGSSRRATATLEALEATLRDDGRVPLLRRVHRSLRSLGRQPRPMASDVGPFTAAQADVLDLVGRGLDTRTIARRLLITEPTVESHIRAAMQRVGARSRMAAALALVRAHRPQVATGSPRPQLTLTEGPALETGHTTPDVVELPATPWLLPGHCAHVLVDSEDTAAHALVAATRGVSLDVTLTPALPPSSRAHFVDALHRLGDVRTRIGTPRIPVDDDLRAAIAVLGDGGTIIQAARAANVSARTLQRRLAELRSAAGLRNNAALARRLASGAELVVAAPGPDRP